MNKIFIHSKGSEEVVEARMTILSICPCQLKCCRPSISFSRKPSKSVLKLQTNALTAHEFSLLNNRF